MPEYNGWTEQMEVYENSKFIRVSDLIVFVNQVRRKSIATHASREEIRSSIANLPCEIIVGRTRRFPDTGLFANLTFGCVANIFDSIIAYLDSVDQREFSHSLNHLMQISYKPIQCLSLCDIYNRASFEAKYNVTWTVEDETTSTLPI